MTECHCHLLMVGQSKTKAKNVLERYVNEANVYAGICDCVSKSRDNIG